MLNAQERLLLWYNKMKTKGNAPSWRDFWNYVGRDPFGKEKDFFFPLIIWQLIAYFSSLVFGFVTI